MSDSSIEHLGLGYTSLTDAGMPALTEFSSLRSLDLQSTALGDKGLRFLAEASLLNRLYLENTKITNSGIQFLLKLPLESLSLNRVLDDGGLKVLSRHATLQRLAIWAAKVTSWQPLSLLERLQVLLIDDAVEDLSPLQSLRQLKVLLLWGNNFSPTQLAKLRIGLPKCQIKHFKPHKKPIDEFRSLCRYA